jgi:hypothetical protein
LGPWFPGAATEWRSGAQAQRSASMRRVAALMSWTQNKQTGQKRSRLRVVGENMQLLARKTHK